jgi:single-strand DNA-binding protein
MAGSVNKVTLIGNLGRDPEIRNAQDGSKIITMNIATSESWKDKNSGERKEKTEWHRVVVFNERINDVIEKYVKKGSKIFIEGSLQTRKWTDQTSGLEKFTTEVVISRYKGELVLLDGRGEGGASSGGYPPPPSEEDYGSSSSKPATTGHGSSEGWQQKSSDLDDEIPF